VLDHIIRNTNIIDCIGRYIPTKRYSGPSRALMTIQLLLSNRALSFHKTFGIFGFPDSQFNAYLPAVDANLFEDAAGVKVNIAWCLHLVNFFRHHLTNPEESSLIEEYQDLDKASEGRSLPQYWKEQLTDEETERKPLGKHWKGTYGTSPEQNQKDNYANLYQLILIVRRCLSFAAVPQVRPCSLIAMLIFETKRFR